MHMTMNELAQMQGKPVYDSLGEKIGSVEEIFYDQQTNQPEWIGIGTGFLGTKRVLVPIEGADVSRDGISVRYDKKQVKGSPDIDSDVLSEATEHKLYAYYGLEPSTPRSLRGDAGTSVTRTEEELTVGKTQHEAGRARLRKWVETEPVEMDVQLKRETARVTREVVDEPVSDAALGDEEVEVTLREEQPVVHKQAVAKERIGLEKDVDIERETVSDEVRKERVDIEGDVDRR
jgi:uncharacterized protein (TIGR02271 family)